MTQEYYPARPTPDKDSTNEREHRRDIARSVGLAMQGLTNNTISVTLTAGATTTTITDDRITLSTAVILVPQTAHAAAENCWIVPSAGQAVINHSNAATTDRTFNVALVG